MNDFLKYDFFQVMLCFNYIYLIVKLQEVTKFSLVINTFYLHSKDNIIALK